MKTPQEENSMTTQSQTVRFLTPPTYCTTNTMLNSSPLSIEENSIDMLTYSDDSIGSTSLTAKSASTSAVSLESEEQYLFTMRSSGRDITYENLDNSLQKKKAVDIVTETMDNAMKKKKVIPAPDRFAVKKLKSTKTLENELTQSSHALNVVAKTYMQRQHGTIQQQSQQQHPYIVAIAEAMKEITQEKQLICFMKIMQVISNHVGVHRL